MAEKWRIVGVVAALVTADALNLGVFYMGDPAGPAHLLVTMCYMAVWICFIAHGRGSRRRMGFSAVFGGLTAATAAVCLIIRMWSGSELLLIPGMLGSALFMTPFYGLDLLISNFNAYYAMLLLLGMIWLGASLYLFRWADDQTYHH